VAKNLSDDALPELRRICLALPEATEKEAWGEPTFRVRDKIFAMCDNDHHGSGHFAVWCKAAPETQDLLVHADPARFFVPPYVGHKGWIGIRLNDRAVDWAVVTELATDAYRLIAPKRLIAVLDATG